MGCFSALRSAAQAFHSHKKQSMKKQKALAKCYGASRKKKRTTSSPPLRGTEGKQAKKKKLISDPRYVVQKRSR